MERNVEIVHAVGTARYNRHCSVLHQPSQHAAFGSAAHWLLQPPHLPMARKLILTTTTPHSYYERETDKYPRGNSLHKCQKQLLPQKPVGPMFYDANIGLTGYIIRIQLRLRSFGFPVCFCSHLHRKWQTLNRMFAFSLQTKKGRVKLPVRLSFST